MQHAHLHMTVISASPFIAEVSGGLIFKACILIVILDQVRWVVAASSERAQPRSLSKRRSQGGRYRFELPADSWGKRQSLGNVPGSLKQLADRSFPEGGGMSPANPLAAAVCRR